MKISWKRFSCTAGAIAIAVMLGPPSAPVARAELGSTPAIGWRQLGLSDRIELLGSNQPADVRVPVPEGVSPAMLTGYIGSVVNATGRFDVLDARGVVLGSVPIPTDIAAAPFAVNIAGASVSAGIVKLTMVLRADNTPNDSCSQPPSVALTQLATTYSGPTPNPRTIADFLPGYLDQITILLGDNPTRDQQQAALSLVAKLTHTFRPMPVRIGIDTTSVPLAASPGGISRTIAIRDGGPSGLVVENPGSATAVLAISGTGPELLRQVELFADRRFDLIQTPAASVTSAHETSPKSSDIHSFQELGMVVEASVLGTATLYTGFDAASFAVGPIDRASVHLIANHTPVTTGDASIVLRAGSAILATRVLNESGAVDLSGVIPAGSIESKVGLALEIRYIPRQECAPLYDRMSFAVDGDSTVTVSPGTNNRGGFPVLPMAFTPEFDVAVDNPDQIRFAAQAINLMGQQSTVALQPYVTTLEEAAQRQSGLLTVAAGDRLAQVVSLPPLLTNGVDAVDVNGIPVTGVDVTGPMGIIQAFTEDGRTVLAISGSDDWSMVDRGFEYIRGLEGGWSSLSGDVVATGAMGTTVNFTVREGGPMPYQPVAGTRWQWWTWITVGVAVLAVVVAATVLVTRRRRAPR